MALSYFRRRLSSTDREKLYDRCRGDKEFPDCNICGLPVDGTRQAWDESHDPEGAPHCFGGTETGVAHRDCNRRHGAEVVIPMNAKADRVRQNFIGASVTSHKMPCGRDSTRKKTMDGRVVARQPRLSRIAADDSYDALIDAVATEVNQS